MRNVSFRLLFLLLDFQTLHPNIFGVHQDTTNTCIIYSLLFSQLYYESFPLKNTMAVKAASLLFFVTMVPRIAKSIALEKNSCNHVTTPMKFHHNHSYLIHAIMIYSYLRFSLHHDQKITCFNPHHDHLDKTADDIADDTCIQIITHSILSEQLKLSLT